MVGDTATGPVNPLRRLGATADKSNARVMMADPRMERTS